MNISVTSGSSLAAVATSLLLAGAVAAPTYAAEEAKGHCMGANACTGQSACKTASNACKGQNGCKGKGFSEMTKDECAKVEGAKFEPATK